MQISSYCADPEYRAQQEALMRRHPVRPFFSYNENAIFMAETHINAAYVIAKRILRERRLNFVGCSARYQAELLNHASYLAYEEGFPLSFLANKYHVLQEYIRDSLKYRLRFE